MSKIEDQKKQDTNKINDSQNELTDDQLDNVSGGFRGPTLTNPQSHYRLKPNPYHYQNNKEALDWDKLVEKKLKNR